LARLLTTLLTHAEKDFYQKELAVASGAGLYTVQRELARLEKAGLVTRMPRGNRVYYRANRGHPAFEDLKRVILKTVGLGEALRTALASLTGRVRVAFIYGSFARGDETVGSDAEEMVAEARAFRRELLAWLQKNHPALVPTGAQ
jgi:DNA-binding transcriptional ArsR family regulator